MLKKNLLNSLLAVHASLKDALLLSDTVQEFYAALRNLINDYFDTRPMVREYYRRDTVGPEAFAKLNWQDYAAIRIMDMLHHEGATFIDPNLHGAKIKSHPLTLLWETVQDHSHEISHDLLTDLIKLFAQFFGTDNYTKPTLAELESWMANHPAGIDEDVVQRRLENRDRIVEVIRKDLVKNGGGSGKYELNTTATEDEQREQILSWWGESAFHLKFAIREIDTLNEMVANSLDRDTLEIMEDAENHGIPIFVNPYYLSLLDVATNDGKRQADLAIRMYIFYSRSLIDEFGQISAWEKEDVVELGKPNAAGWLLPSHNLHRRYPEVAILIPDTIGRACGGLCSSCQRMYGFQSGDFNFDLDKLSPKESWPDKLERLLAYYENDSQLRDLLITGGDALMSTDKSLKQILDRVYEMAKRKIEANKGRTEKYAEISRVRLGTRLPVYLPQRITAELVEVLNEFRVKARAIGIRQFVIQTHFESAMEVTPEAAEGIRKLLSSGWYVTNQLVFTSGAALRGHTAKLRKVLNDCGVLTYYTFSVKGYRENRNNFATNARAVQEMLEEKSLGTIPTEMWPEISALTEYPADMIENIEKLRESAGLPFLATDRNVINLPGIGKSQTFRTIGMTDDGRRILLFDHDTNRSHSPVTDEMEEVVIIESKPMAQYIRELKNYGEDISLYDFTYGYSMAETEPLMPIFKYPTYEFSVTEGLTNFEMPKEF